MFGAHCFDKIMSDEKFYKQCQDHCLEDCEDTTTAIWHTFLPLNTDDVCKEGQLIYQHLNQTFRKHFAFENYKVSVMTFFGDGIEINFNRFKHVKGLVLVKSQFF